MTTKVTTSSDDSRSPVEKFLNASRFADYGVWSSVLPETLELKGANAEERPAWVIRCGKKLMAALFPKIQPVAAFEDKTRHHQAGFALGMVEAGCRMLTDLHERLKPWPEVPEPTDEQVKLGLRSLFGDFGECMFEVLKGDGGEFSEWWEKFESEMTLAQAAEYAEGNAVALKMMAGQNNRNDATDIHLFLFTFWRVVERLENVDQLHEVLTKVFGRNRIGYDPKRVAQICLRVGKKFRAKGRPRKQPHAKRRVRYFSK